jgi:UPF0755 protein
MKRPLPGIAATIALIFLAIAIGLVLTVFLPSKPGVSVPGPEAEGILVRIPRGASAKDAAEILGASGLIRSRLLFLAGLRVTGTDRRIKAGSYRIKAGSSLAVIIGILSEGKVALSRITIPEGLASRGIGEILEREGICSAQAFLAAARDESLARTMGIAQGNFEGYLFPDTYLLSPETDPVQILRVMKSTFDAKVAGLQGREVRSIGNMSREDLILASIVEREYRLPEEAPLIASVFRNRLALGMPLQSCATVVYVLTEIQGRPHPSVVTYADLEIRDQFNTYRHKGLPPAPISNPGLTALAAALATPESTYLYFRIADEEKGSHKFSSTFDEHRGTAGPEVLIPVKGF